MSVSEDSAPHPSSGTDGLATSNQKYRLDFDGLRAIAVLAVIALHVGLVPAPGGVDVFFVLSGFLISGNIIRGLSAHKFSFSDFYARRVRRIFPPLLVMLLTLWLFSWLILLPDEYRVQGKYIAAGASFVLNFVDYWNITSIPYITGYPATSHLWSLAIEERFYLFWPILLLIIWKFFRTTFIPVVLVAAASYAAFVATSAWDPDEAYSMPWTRMCELAFGGAVACYQIERPRNVARIWQALQSRWPAALKLANCHVRATIGAVLLVAWFAGLNRIYGWTVSAPSIGTALLVTSGPKSWVNRYILAATPIVFVGRISYPLYLWHIPALLIAYVISSSWSPNPGLKAGAVVLSSILAVLTYKYVELPFALHLHLNI